MFDFIEHLFDYDVRASSSIVPRFITSFRMQEQAIRVMFSCITDDAACSAGDAFTFDKIENSCIDVAKRETLAVFCKQE